MLSRPTPPCRRLDQAHAGLAHAAGGRLARGARQDEGAAISSGEVAVASRGAEGAAQYAPCSSAIMPARSSRVHSRPSLTWSVESAVAPEMMGESRAP